MLAFVQPRTAIAWQKKRFREHWRRLSQRRTPGRLSVAQEIRDLIRDMSRAKSTWGSPRIVGELRKLGIDVATSTVEKYRVRPRKAPSPTWRTFLNNHMQEMIALDCFGVPTVTFRVLFVLVILAHARRRVVHCNVTAHPTTQWTAQQVVEAFPWNEAPRYLLRDRDRIYGAVFRQRVKPMGIKEGVSAPKSPWQHPYVERLMGSMRQECLNHGVVFHERPRARILTSSLASDHQWRTHLSLAMDGPEPRPVLAADRGRVIVVPEVGGLHHHYERHVA